MIRQRRDAELQPPACSRLALQHLGTRHHQPSSAGFIHALLKQGSPAAMQLPDEEGGGLGAGEQLTHLGRSLDDLDEFGGRVSALGVCQCETAEGDKD